MRSEIAEAGQAHDGDFNFVDPGYIAELKGKIVELTADNRALTMRNTALENESSELRRRIDASNLPPLE